MCQKPKVIIEFEPAPAFQEEFLEFVEEVLSWSSGEEQTEKAPINNRPLNNKGKENVEEKSKTNNYSFTRPYYAYQIGQQNGRGI